MDIRARQCLPRWGLSWSSPEGKQSATPPLPRGGEGIMWRECNHHPQRLEDYSPEALSNSSICNRRSLVFTFIKVWSPRDSTFKRTTGSVLEERRLKRQLSNSMLSPSIVEICFASAS